MYIQIIIKHLFNAYSVKDIEILEIPESQELLNPSDEETEDSMRPGKIFFKSS